jgi:uncharacterized repeat protein (TIGR01451 family)
VLAAGKATSTTATQLSAASIILGENVTDTVTVTGASGTPGGTIIFQVSTDGGTTFTAFGATKTLDSSGQAVSDSYAPTSTGTSYFRAIYSGNSRYNGSLSDNTAEPLTTATAQGPHLSFTKTVSPATYSRLGDVLTYTLVATNGGSVNLTNVSISDPGLVIVESVPEQPATLIPGARLTVTGTHTVNQGDLNIGFFFNTATASSNEVAPVSATEEGLRAPIVGGEDTTINMARVLAPWLGLGLVLLLGGIVLTVLSLRRRTSR